MAASQAAHGGSIPLTRLFPYKNQIGVGLRAVKTAPLTLSERRFVLAEKRRYSSDSFFDLIEIISRHAASPV